VTTAFRNKYYSGHHRVIKKVGGQTHWEERGEKRNVDNGLQVYPEENGVCTRQYKMERSGL